ncbi:MAG: transcription initiation protein [Sphingobacteriales bacterium]|nr:MAG: transcription initiation protein [Sphingobacteriales bacterium]
MKTFMLLFRQPSFEYSSDEEYQAVTQKWQNWLKDITTQEKLEADGARLAVNGKVLKAGGVVTDGPFVELREILGSFITIRAGNIEEATTIAHGCPSLEVGGSVEIRPLWGEDK